MRKLSIPTLSGYQDRDEILLHAVFTILVDFYEKEKPEQSSITDDISQIGIGAVHDWNRLKCLYVWWKYCYNKIDSVHSLAEYDFKTERLKELIDLRKQLWT